jgi:membrane protein DedA with SNARE-associated domain
VTLNYDSLYWTTDTLSAFVQQLRRSQIEEYEPLRLQDVATSRIQPSTYWRVAGYFALVFGIILFALPMIPGGTPLLFLSTVCFSKALSLEQAAAALI